MRLRTQLAIAFFLLAVLPLLGVTLYTWLGSERAFRQAVTAEAGDLAAEMSTRVDVVAERAEGSADAHAAAGRGVGEESPYQKARREALAVAEGAELRLLLRAILSGAERRQGAIPFARDPDGKVYAPDPADEAVLAGLGQVPGKPADAPRRGGVGGGRAARPGHRDRDRGGASGGPGAPGDARAPRRNNLALGLGLALVALLGILPLSRRMTRHLASLADGAGGSPPGTSTCACRCPTAASSGTSRRRSTSWPGTCAATRSASSSRSGCARSWRSAGASRRCCCRAGRSLGPFAEVGGISIPAREVGGDFFNYFPLRETEVAILVGDVSGKGVGAALLMASLQATIRARLGAERDLAPLVDALDLEMGSDEPLAPYYTLFLALLEGSTGRLRYVNAGHNTQFVLRRDGAPSGSPRPGGPPGLYPGGGLRGVRWSR